MKFSAYVLFIADLEFSNILSARTLDMGCGWLGKLGVFDFAGGIVIHTSAGMGALAALLVLGKDQIMVHRSWFRIVYQLLF